ncbi:MAG: hypothetical protein ACR2JQ_08935 [Mycobacteriales bacterium]
MRIDGSEERSDAVVVRVRAATAAIASLGDHPVSEHPAGYEELHRELARALRAADDEDASQRRAGDEPTRR